MDNTMAGKFVTKIWTKSHTYTVTPFKYFMGFYKKKKAGSFPTEKQKTSMGKEQQDGRNWLKETLWN